MNVDSSLDNVREVSIKYTEKRNRKTRALG
jgi:hypothetical protein